MKQQKITCLNNTFICSKKPSSNFSNEKYTLCGRKDSSEFRVITSFPLETIINLNKKTNNICKIEFNIYLSQISIENPSNNFMLNIGINLSNTNIKTVSYTSAPKFKQLCSMFVFKKNFSSSYLNLDITHIIKEILNKNNERNASITMLCLNDDSMACFDSCSGTHPPYITVYYNEDINDDLDDIEQSAYGLFFNKNGSFNPDNDISKILWDYTAINSNIALSENKSDIVLRYKGAYSIDYEANIRSSSLTSIYISINDKCIPYTSSIVDYSECSTTKNVIIRCTEDYTKVNLCIKGTNIMLVENGTCSTIRIIKI